MSDTPKRGWLSFSIRDLLLVTVIVALVLGWWLDRTWSRAQLKRVQDESAEWKHDAEVHAKLLRELPPTGVDYPPSVLPALKMPKSPAPAADPAKQ